MGDRAGGNGRAELGLGGDAVGELTDEPMPYGVDTIVFRIEFPAEVAAPGYGGRMWRMRPRPQLVGN